MRAFSRLTALGAALVLLAGCTGTTPSASQPISQPSATPSPTSSPRPWRTTTTTR